MPSRDSSHGAMAPHNKTNSPKSYLAEFPPAEGKRPFSETINKPIAEVSKIVGNAKKLPEFLEHLEKVESKEALSDWHFRGSSGNKVAFKASSKADSFSYASEDKLGFAYHLQLQLVPAPAGRGTIVRMFAAYESGAGSSVAKVEELFGPSAELHAKKTLQRLKAYCETGHVPTIEGQPSGREE